eukprot:259749-Rhodomonas_salina.3
MTKCCVQRIVIVKRCIPRAGRNGGAAVADRRRLKAGCPACLQAPRDARMVFPQSLATHQHQAQAQH